MSMPRAEVRAYGAVLVLLAAAAVMLLRSRDALVHDERAMSVVLPAAVGNWIGHRELFCHAPACRREFLEEETGGDGICPACGAPLFPMHWVEREQLGPDTGIHKSLYTDGAGRRMWVSIVVSSRERSSIHRPERCLVAQGYHIQEAVTRDIAVRGRDPLRVRRLALLRNAPGQTPPLEGVYVYWFAGKGRETSSHYARLFWVAWDRVAHSTASRWAYISVMGAGSPESAEWRDFLKAFVESWYATALGPASVGAAAE